MSSAASQASEWRQASYNAILVELIKANPDLAIMRIKPDFPIPPHHSGQYATIGLGAWEPRLPVVPSDEVPPDQQHRLIRRAYSISHPILGQGGQLAKEHLPFLEFYIVLLRLTGAGEPSALTPRLFMLKEGDRLFLGEKITGHYSCQFIKPHETVLFLSTGTGEAPHNYMIWDLLKRGHQGPLISVCCVRHAADLGYLKTYQTLTRAFPQVHYLPLTTREPNQFGQKLYIQDLIATGLLESHLGIMLDPGNTHVFLCGNPNMIGAPKIHRETGERQYPATLGCVEILEKRGFVSDHLALKKIGTIHYEEYWKESAQGTHESS